MPQSSKQEALDDIQRRPYNVDIEETIYLFMCLEMFAEGNRTQPTDRLNLLKGVSIMVK